MLVMNLVFSEKLLSRPLQAALASVATFSSVEAQFSFDEAREDSIRRLKRPTPPARMADPWSH